MAISKIVLQAESKSLTWLRDLGIVIGSSVLISLMAPLAIRLPFSPIPIAFAIQTILFLSVLIGSKRATLAVLAYLIQGLMGLPVFAAGGSGILYFLGPTGGFLIGYLASAYVTGKLVENMKVRSASKVFLAMLAGNGMVYVFGLPYLATFVGFEKAILLGLVPFIPGELVKLALAQATLRKLRFFA